MYEALHTPCLNLGDEQERSTEDIIMIRIDLDHITNNDIHSCTRILRGDRHETSANTGSRRLGYRMEYRGGYISCNANRSTPGIVGEIRPSSIQSAISAKERSRLSLRYIRAPQKSIESRSPDSCLTAVETR